MAQGFPPLIYVDLIETPALSKTDFAEHLEVDKLADLDAAYDKYIDEYQPWRSLIKSGDNEKPLFRSTERYFNRADAIHAIQIGFGNNSNVYLREAEHGNVELRLASAE